MNSSFPFDGTQIGSTAYSIGLSGDGNFYGNDSYFGSSGGAVANADVLGVAVDIDNKKIWFRKNNGNWNNSGTANPATNTEGIDITYMVSGTLYPAAAPYFASMTANFGASAYGYTAPSGFSNW